MPPDLRFLLRALCSFLPTLCPEPVLSQVEGPFVLCRSAPRGDNHAKMEIPNSVLIQAPRERLRRIPVNNKNTVKPQKIFRPYCCERGTMNVRKSAQPSASG